MVQYPLVSFAEKRNLIFTANKVNPAQDPRDKFQRTNMMMPSVAIDEYELFFSDSHPSYIIGKRRWRCRFRTEYSRRCSATGNSFRIER